MPELDQEIQKEVKENLKILIILTYFERPNMVKNALNSILINNETYKNWELGFIDDGSIKRGKPVVEEILKDHLDKVKFYYINDTIEDKLNRKCIVNRLYQLDVKSKDLGGSMHGKYINKAIQESDADVCFFLMDDDFLVNNYFNNLNIWFTSNSNAMYCCSNWVKYVVGFNDVWGMKEKVRKKAMVSFSWRTKCNKEDNIWLHYPTTICIDNSFCEDLFNKYGYPLKVNWYSDFFSCCRIIHKGRLTDIINWNNENSTKDEYNVGEANIDMNYILDCIQNNKIKYE